MRLEYLFYLRNVCTRKNLQAMRLVAAVLVGTGINLIFASLEHEVCERSRAVGVLCGRSREPREALAFVDDCRCIYLQLIAGLFYGGPQKIDFRICGMISNG